MQVKDFMATDVVTAKPGDTVAAVAKVMSEKRVSGLPVVDDDGALVGVVSEGDLLSRTELGRDAPRSWWLGLLGRSETPEAYVRAHGQTVADVMTREVETIAPGAGVAALARKLEKNGVKRLPVVDRGQLVGVVSRADVVRALASMQPEATPTAADDTEIRNQVIGLLNKEAALAGCQATVIVNDGVVELWGLATDEASAEACRVAAAGVAGVKEVENHMALFPSSHYS